MIYVTPMQSIIDQGPLPRWFNDLQQKAACSMTRSSFGVVNSDGLLTAKENLRKPITGETIIRGVLRC